MLQNRDPQGLRRPRFSFFFSTCQTARRMKRQNLFQRHSTIIQQPRPIGYFITVAMLISVARQTARAVGPGAAALSGRVIGGTARSCQRPIVRNTSRRSRVVEQYQKRLFYR